MVPKTKVVIKGDYINEDNRYIFRNEHIIASRRGSIVEIIDDNKVSVMADVLGIDKLYYAMNKETIIISNKFKDFSAYPIDDNLWPIQLSKGVIPYPFTILKGIRRALPGIKIRFIKKFDKDWSYEYSTEELQTFFNTKPDYSIKDFKEAFLSNINKLKALCDRNVMISFSGGFDSLLLSNLFKEHVIGLCHYTNELDKTWKNKQISSYIPDVPWCIFFGDELIEQSKIALYFNSIDEPCCCIAGLGAFLMFEKLYNHIAQKDNLYIVDGGGADTIFSNGRNCFKEFLLGRIFLENNIGLRIDKKVTTDTIQGKFVDYLKSTKTRFYDHYTKHVKLKDEYKNEISSIYDLYANSLKAERATLFGMLKLLLDLSLTDIERIKTIANSFNCKFILPFFDPGIIKLAFSIPAKYKVGYKSGKKILRKSFSEINKAPYKSESFIPRKTWRSLKNVNNVETYIKYYAYKWLEQRDKGRM